MSMEEKENQKEDWREGWKEDAIRMRESGEEELFEDTLDDLDGEWQWYDEDEKKEENG